MPNCLTMAGTRNAPYAHQLPPRIPPFERDGPIFWSPACSPEASLGQPDRDPHHDQDGPEHERAEGRYLQVTRLAAQSLPERFL